jgi:predicted MFS family arabinose efflux permease
LLVGASLGGVVAALLGREAVFLLNALSFLASAILIGRMKFEEPHAQSAAPLRIRDAVDFSPIAEGMRYVRKDRRLMAAVFAKAGELMIGPSWVLFTVMGQQYFHVHLLGIDPQRSAVLGMSLLLGARGIGAVVGPLLSARLAGRSDTRLRLGILLGYLIIGAGYFGLGISPTYGWLACVSRWPIVGGQPSGFFPPRCCSSTPMIASAAGSFLPISAWLCSPSPLALTSVGFFLIGEYQPGWWHRRPV